MQASLLSAGKSGLLLLAGLWFGCGWISSVQAMWAPVALEILLDEADLVVEGRVVRVEPLGLAGGLAGQDAAVIQVDSTLKALPHVGKPTLVRVAQPSRRGLAVSTDLKYAVGDRGIWLLAKDPEQDFYRVRHPFQLQPLADKKNLADLLSARAKLPAGKPYEGLAAKSELLMTLSPAGVMFFEVRTSIQNVSDKPLMVCLHNGQRPLVVQWLGADGQPHESRHYEPLQRLPVPPVAREDFVTLFPGSVRFVGPHSRDQGIFFQSPAANVSPGSNVATQGKHAVGVSFQARETGENFQLKGVWTGTIAAPAVQLFVP